MPEHKQKMTYFSEAKTIRRWNHQKQNVNFKSLAPEHSKRAEREGIDAQSV